MSGFNRPLEGFRLAEVRQGDTLQALALRELGDAAKWPLLIALNGLSPPYLTGDPALAGERVRLYGDLLVVPAAAAEVSAEAAPDLVFGVDAELRRGRLEAAEGDFALVSGRPNLRQALKHRLDTDLGELVFHPRYGCEVHRMKGQGGGATSAALAAAYVKGALLGDDRVSTVDRSTARILGDAIAADAVITPVAGVPVDLSVVV